MNERNYPRDDRASRFRFERFTHGRKRPAHPPPIEIGNRPIILFVTVCAAQRKTILANDEAVGVVVSAWQAANHWHVGRYVILPDHIHLFCAPGRADASPVQKWVAFWKSKASNNWPEPNEQPIWQTDCWDTRCDGARTMTRNGITSGVIRCGTV